MKDEKTGVVIEEFVGCIRIWYMKIVSMKRQIA